MRKTVVLSVFLSLVAILAGCTPNTSPTKTPSPTISPAQASSGKPAASSTQSAEDAAWAKVVAAAQKEGKLTIYSYNFSGDIGIAVSKAFKDKYGIQVNIITGKGAEFIQRLDTEKRTGGIQADILDQNPTNAGILKQRGFTATIANDLPSLRDNSVWVADIYGIDPQEKHIISFIFSTYSPYVNTKLVKTGEEPKVWKDLLDPKWKGKLVTTNPTTSAGLIQNLVPLLREKVIDEQFIKDLYKQDIMFATALPEEAGILARGERSLSISSFDTVSSQFIVQGAPIRAAEFADGTVLTPTVIVALGESPDPNAAKLFINWLMSAEGQTVWAKAASVSSVRKDVPSFLAEAARVMPKHPIIFTPQDATESSKLFQQQYVDKLWGR